MNVSGSAFFESFKYSINTTDNPNSRIPNIPDFQQVVIYSFVLDGMF